MENFFHWWIWKLPFDLRIFSSNDTEADTSFLDSESQSRSSVVHFVQWQRANAF